MTDTAVALDRLGKRALGVGALGLAACLAGLLVDPDRLFRSYLLGWLFWANLAIGCLSITTLQHLTGGRWGMLIRRFLEAGTRTFVHLAVLFVPIAIGVGRIYPWAAPDALADEAIVKKALYLNRPFFLGRALFYFAAWIVIAHFLNRWSLKLDAGPDRKTSARLGALSGGGIVLLGLTITFSSIDWGMSLNPHWFSTIYGLLFMLGQALSALALTIVLVAWTAGAPPVSRAARPETVADLGNLMLAFTMLWAYLNLSQFLIIWSGNVSEETPFYVRRMAGGWGGVGLLLVLFHFALPFVLLLSRDLKRDARRLGRLAGLMLGVRVLDLFWLIGPDLAGHDADAMRVHWLDLAALAGIGGIWVHRYTSALGDRPLLPVGEPEIRAVLTDPPGAAEAAR